MKSGDSSIDLCFEVIPSQANYLWQIAHVSIHNFRYLPGSEVAGLKDAETLVTHTKPSWIGIAKLNHLLGNWENGAD